MKLGIVIGSIRVGRVSDRVAKWVAKEAQNLSGTEVQIIDLIDYPMPIFNESAPPQANPDREVDMSVRRFLDVISPLDALVLVTPEYNRSYSSVLKNAIDYLDFQLYKKPVQLVAHGSTGGAQAVSHLRAVLPGLGAITNPIAVMLTERAGNIINEDGELNEELKSSPDGPQNTLKNALNDLKWYSDALATARQ